jgi:hypothetical protein
MRAECSSSEREQQQSSATIASRVSRSSSSDTRSARNQERSDCNHARNIRNTAAAAAQQPITIAHGRRSSALIHRSLLNTTRLFAITCATRPYSSRYNPALQPLSLPLFFTLSHHPQHTPLPLAPPALQPFSPLTSIASRLTSTQLATRQPPRVRVRGSVGLDHSLSLVIELNPQYIIHQ